MNIRISNHEQRWLKWLWFDAITDFLVYRNVTWKNMTDWKSALVDNQFISDLRDLQKEWFKLPTQTQLPSISAEQLRDWFQVIIYSQTDQNNLDRLMHESWCDYAEDKYIIMQWGKEYSITWTYSTNMDWPINNDENSVKEYMDIYPDSIILGIWKFDRIVEFE